MRKWNLAAIEQAFAAAALDPSLWSAAVECVASQTESRGALLLPIVGRPLPTVPVTESLLRPAETYFRDGWHSKDVRYNIDIDTFARVGVTDDFVNIDPERLKRDPFYQEFLAPFGLRWYGGVALNSGDDLWCLSINRGIDQTPFSPREKQKLSELSRALSTAASMSRALGFAASTATLDAFEFSQTALVLLSRMGEVVRTNRSADTLLRDDIRIVERRVMCKDRESTSALDKALYELLWGTSGSALSPAVPLKRAGQSPILAYPFIIPTLNMNVMSRAQAAIILVDPTTRRRLPEANLQRAFRLTPAEARLASRFGLGDPLEVICEQLSISKETGRNQLKSIFAKTGVRRQSELMLVLARML